MKNHLVLLLCLWSSLAALSWGVEHRGLKIPRIPIMNPTYLLECLKPNPLPEVDQKSEFLVIVELEDVFFKPAHDGSKYKVRPGWEEFVQELYDNYEVKVMTRMTINVARPLIKDMAEAVSLRSKHGGEGMKNYIMTNVLYRHDLLVHMRSTTPENFQRSDDLVKDWAIQKIWNNPDGRFGMHNTAILDRIWTSYPTLYMNLVMSRLWTASQTDNDSQLISKKLKDLSKPEVSVCRDRAATIMESPFYIKMSRYAGADGPSKTIDRTYDPVEEKEGTTNTDKRPAGKFRSPKSGVKGKPRPDKKTQVTAGEEEDGEEEHVYYESAPERKAPKLRDWGKEF